jgi:hypothetical protein
MNCRTNVAYIDGEEVGSIKKKYPGAAASWGDVRPA